MVKYILFKHIDYVKLQRIKLYKRPFADFEFWIYKIPNYRDENICDTLTNTIDTWLRK